MTVGNHEGATSFTKRRKRGARAPTRKTVLIEGASRSWLGRFGIIICARDSGEFFFFLPLFSHPHDIGHVYDRLCTASEKNPNIYVLVMCKQYKIFHIFKCCCGCYWRRSWLSRAGTVLFPFSASPFWIWTVGPVHLTRLSSDRNAIHVRQIKRRRVRIRICDKTRREYEKDVGIGFNRWLQIREKKRRHSFFGAAAMCVGNGRRRRRRREMVHYSCNILAKVDVDNCHKFYQSVF